MNEKPEAWTAIDSFVWPHIAANLIREQHAEIERLKAALPYDWDQLKACRGSLREHMVEINRLKVENEALRRDAERLWKALKHYGKHDDDCGDYDAYNNESLRHCGCGLDAVLDETLGDKT